MSPSITERETFVLKFGGTSVGTGKRLLEVSDIVKSYTGRTVVVLSAMSGSIKSQGTTSRLLEACQEVLKPNSQRYIDIVDSLEKDHLSAARDAFTLSLNEVAVEEKVIQNDGSPSPLTEEYRSNCHPLFIQDIFSKLTKNIKAECSKLRQFMIAAEVIDELSPRSQDFIISAGEKLSALIFASVLESQSISELTIKTLRQNTSLWIKLFKRNSIFLKSIRPFTTIWSLYFERHFIHTLMIMYA